MAAYDIPSLRIDGNDVNEVIYYAKWAIEEKVRSNCEPYLLEMDTTRLCWHKQGQRDVRTPEEIAKLAERDPIKREAEHLGLTEGERDKIWKETEEAVDGILARVYQDPWPTSIGR